MSDLIIRTAELSDLSELAVLSTELGYPSSAPVIENRIGKILNSNSDIVFVAVEKKIVIGWIHVFSALRLESDPFAEIAGLIVASKHRSKGIGKILVNEAEKWAKEKGFTNIRVRSRTSRKEARRFYEREGYSVIKNQNVFEKSLE